MVRLAERIRDFLRDAGLGEHLRGDEAPTWAAAVGTVALDNAALRSPLTRRRWAHALLSSEEARDAVEATYELAGTRWQGAVREVLLRLGAPPDAVVAAAERVRAGGYSDPESVRHLVSLILGGD